MARQNFNESEPAPQKAEYAKAAEELNKELEENGIGINERAPNLDSISTVPKEKPEAAPEQKAEGAPVHELSFAPDIADRAQALAELESYLSELRELLQDAEVPEAKMQDVWKQFKESAENVRTELKRADANEADTAEGFAQRIRIGNRVEDLERAARALTRLINTKAGETRVTITESELAPDTETLVAALKAGKPAPALSNRIARAEELSKKGDAVSAAERAELRELKRGFETALLNQAEAERNTETESTEAAEVVQENVPETHEKTPEGARAREAPKTEMVGRAWENTRAHESIGADEREGAFVYTVKDKSETLVDALSACAPEKLNALSEEERVETLEILKDTLANLPSEDLRHIGIENSNTEELAVNTRIDLSVVFDNPALLERAIAAAKRRLYPDNALDSVETEARPAEETDAHAERESVGSPALDKRAAAESMQPVTEEQEMTPEGKVPEEKQEPKTSEEPAADASPAAEHVETSEQRDAETVKGKPEADAEKGEGDAEEPPEGKAQTAEEPEEETGEKKHAKEKLQKLLTAYAGRKGILGFGKKLGTDTRAWRYTRKENIVNVSTSTAQKFEAPEKEFAGLQSLIRDREQYVEPREDETVEEFLLRSIHAENAQAQQ